MATLGRFAQNMRRHAQNIEANGSKLQRTVAAAVLSAVVLATPVGNPTLWKDHRGRKGYVGGRARGNWQVGIGGAKTQTVNAVDAGGHSTIEQGKATMEQSQKGQAIHLTNNLPYIVPLNQGHSHQAPAGFVAVAVQKGSEAVRNAKLLQPGSGGGGNV